MLSELSIENFAIIDSLRVRFDGGFTALTGETGAGKSIIVDALQTALGARAGADVVRGEAVCAVVEAIFNWPDEPGMEPLRSLLAENGIEEDECLILRREVSTSGRGSVRVNGRAVPLAVLSAAGSYLVDIHGQSDHLSILRRDRQLEVLDRYAGLGGRRSDLAAAVKAYIGLRQRLNELQAGQRQAEQRIDLLRFQVQEIDAAQLHEDEEEELTAERNLLVNAERLADLAGVAYESLYGETGAALDAVARASSALRDLAGIDPALAPFADRVQSAEYELEDVAQELRGYRDRVEYDPRRLGAIEERLDLLSRLKRKYGETIAVVMDFGRQARRDLEDVENLDERLQTARMQVSEAAARAGSLAADLSAARQSSARALETAMAKALQGLGLKSTRFEVSVSQTVSDSGLPLPGRPDSYACSTAGIDTIAFLVSFNPGEPLRPLDKVASGGETSRFLLALKSVLAAADPTATLIFDEVDVGVGGRAGMVVGERLRDLSGSHQVISITHLPQVAALADQHLSVSKAISDGRATVAVQSLEAASRVAEIAEMMSGTGSEAARRSAQELLEAARREG